MAFRLCPIASGSSGNCTFVQANDDKILVDVGISGKKAIAGLEVIDVAPNTLKGILITHEHSDHIKGVGIVSRKFDLPIYATARTWEAMHEKASLGKVADHNQCIFETDQAFNIGELMIKPYSIYHDAVDPVGFVFTHEDKKIVMATDLGKIDRPLLEHFYGANGILLEFNHDINMVEVGRYPYSLKKRVLGDYGHLNNELAAKVLTHIYHDALEWAILGHLSKDNNLPDLAYLTAKNALEEKQIYVGKDIHITVAKRDEVTPVHSV